MKVSVVIPVKHGERYLQELLEALVREAPEEILVIDSGSTDRSLEIVAAIPRVSLLQIPAHEFSHGRTRNLGMERTSGELVCFITQDATPVAGWLAAYRQAFALSDDVGAAYGPHLPRPDTSPMIARELTEFFAGFSPDRSPQMQRSGDPTFLSNANASYRRSCWEGIRFRDMSYSEDQAFGSDMLAAGWAKVYHPDAAVLHAHDYGALEFMQRYFDEYRGLRSSLGHVEKFGLRSSSGHVRRLVRGDVQWMRAEGYPLAEQLRWTGRSLTHHAGRKVFSALGSRADALPPAARKRLSFEGSDYAPEYDDAQASGGWPVQQPPSNSHEYAEIARVLAEGPAALAEPVPGMAQRECLHFAFVIPPFTAGSGGHNIIFQLILRLEGAGHTCSVWLDDPFGYVRSEWAGVIRAGIREYFADVQAPLYKGFGAWFGADVVVATGWQTVYPAISLPNARARAYLINDHEPEFYPTSVESIWAARTYSYGLYGICGSPWLHQLYTQRYGGTGEVFNYGVDHDIYYPREIERHRDTVVYYCRSTTPRRAVALGLLALMELRRRRPQVRIVVFGERDPITTSFAYEHVGVASPEQLAQVFSEGTVGLCLSLTNYSLIPQEMLACGLPCIDLQGASAESVFGADGPVELSPFDAIALADHLEALLNDRALWERRSQAGIEFVAERSWDAAAVQVEDALRAALREREAELG